MSSPRNILFFCTLFSMVTVTAQASDPLSPASESSLEQSSGQKIVKTVKTVLSENKKSGKKKSKKKKHQKTTTPPGSSQQANDTKAVVENSDVKRVEKWLEENEASRKKSHVKRVREPVKKKTTQTFSVYLSPDPTAKKTDSKQPEKISPFNLNHPVKPQIPRPAKKLQPPLAPKKSNKEKQAEDTMKFQADLESAESGDPEAQLSAGIKLYKGQGVLQDRKKGFDWLRKAAGSGKFSPESLHILGQAFFKGLDTEKNYAEARKWISVLAEQDNDSAKNDLAYMLYKGLGGDKDYAKAFELYKQAAKHGDVFAQANLGLMYATGTGTKTDQARAYAWYSLAASRGNRAAARNRNALLKGMSWEELNLAQRISVELSNEITRPKTEKPGVNTGQREQTPPKPKP